MIFVTHLLLVSNPFTMAFFQSDLFGKCIFFALITASIVSWIVVIYKLWFLHEAKKGAKSLLFLLEQKGDPLQISYDPSSVGSVSPFVYLHALVGRQAADLMKRSGIARLSAEDIEFLESHLISGINSQAQRLDSHLFILAMVVSLGPFLGLLGTVWGILATFAELQAGGGAVDNQAILGGISLALATTVLGLLDAIPALIGYGYLKQRVRVLLSEMESFSRQMISSLELKYRKIANEGKD